MKIPRDISGAELVKKLSKFGYEISRQKGSHIRLTRDSEKGTHHITIPNHSPMKIGLLAKIIAEIALQLEIPKDELIIILAD
jgi:predicted RNA binding protein YcfA (HicA-like mRNA interferase family)